MILAPTAVSGHGKSPVPELSLMSPTLKFGGGSIMVWGYVMTQGVGSLDKAVEPKLRDPHH